MLRPSSKRRVPYLSRRYPLAPSGSNPRQASARSKTPRPRTRSTHLRTALARLSASSEARRSAISASPLMARSQAASAAERAKAGEARSGAKTPSSSSGRSEKASAARRFTTPLLRSTSPGWASRWRSSATFERVTKFPAGTGPLTARENLSAKLAASSGLGAMKV